MGEKLVSKRDFVIIGIRIRVKGVTLLGHYVKPFWRNSFSEREDANISTP